MKHPGLVLKETVLDTYAGHEGKSQRALAKSAGLPVSKIWRIVRGEIGISAPTAIKLASALGGDPRYWLNLQVEYDLAKAWQAIEAKAKTQRR